MAGSGQRDDEDALDRLKFERFVQERIEIPISDNGLYLTRTVLPQLTNALAEVSTLPCEGNKYIFSTVIF